MLACCPTATWGLHSGFRHSRLLSAHKDEHHTHSNCRHVTAEFVWHAVLSKPCVAVLDIALVFAVAKTLLMLLVLSAEGWLAGRPSANT